MAIQGLKLVGHQVDCFATLAMTYFRLGDPPTPGDEICPAQGVDRSTLYNATALTYRGVAMRLISLLVALFCISPLLQAEEWASRQKVSHSFEDVRDAVVMAIENRGLVINYTSHIADMLAGPARISAPARRFLSGPRSSNSARPSCHVR